MPTPEVESAYAAFRAALTAQGLNLFGVLDGAAYDACCAPAFRRAAVAPDARSAIVVASGGRVMWDAIARAPEAVERHRINRFTQRVIRSAAHAHLGAQTPTCLWPNDMRDEAFLPAVALAIASGLGVSSALALLINPTYGLWIGLRGVILTPLDLPATAPLADAGFAPCPGCHRPCARVCHGQVISEAGYDGHACLATRVATRACRRTCDARLACPVGAEHQYAAAQLAHHARHLLDPRTLGRYALFALRRRFASRAHGSASGDAGAPPPE